MFAILFSGWLLLAGQLPSDSAGPIRQGISGIVRMAGGNLMPAPGAKKHPPGGGTVAVKGEDTIAKVSTPVKTSGVPATVYIYALTNISQVSPQSGAPYFQTISTRLVKVAVTDPGGHFTIGLAAGRYSIFTKKGDLFYAGKRDELNNLFPVEVLPGKVTDVECRVESDHKPVY